MITYDWVISTMDCIVNENGLNNIVEGVHWRFYGNLDDEKKTGGEIFGYQKISEPNLESFTPYEELTKETVVSWLENVINVDEMKTKIELMINDKITPKKVNLTLPNL